MKGLDWTNETWVRLYRSDSPAWKRLKWEAQSVYLGLQRKLDRAGCLSLDGLMDFEAVAEMLGCPEEAAERALPRLYQLGFLVKSEDGDTIVDPEFIERDEAASSDAQRKRDSRARRRDRATSRTVPEKSRNVTEPSHAVTRGHTRSLLDDPRREEKIPEDHPPNPPPGGSPRVAAKPPVPDWAVKAAKGAGVPAREVSLEICRCIAAVRKEDPDPARAKTSAAPVLALWRALGKPDLAEFRTDFELVADAAHRCPERVFARDLRAEGWPDGVDRSYDVATVAVQRRWDERLAVARVWANGRGGNGFDWEAAEAEERRLAPFREALAAAEAEFGEFSAEYDAALSALMEAGA